MNVLFLAPHPFFQNRGTPIAVDLILRGLSERGECVDVLTYHEGQEMTYDHVTVNRIPAPPFIKNIRPGFSLKKLICDAVMAVMVMKLLLKKRYDLIHAVEESVFIALVIKWLFRVPYLYDMDSSLAQQMTEKHPTLLRVAGFLNWCEGLAVKNAEMVVPVCDALSDVVQKYPQNNVVVLRDVSLLSDRPAQPVPSLREEFEIRGLVLMYVGNLELYQGIDLLIESFALIRSKTDRASLVIVGGVVADIEKYTEKAQALGLKGAVHFLGQKPIELLGQYLAQADILMSPRIKGQNTPMKLYSYLHSGRPILATDLPTHTQVLNGEVSVLAEPTSDAFAAGMIRLIEDDALRDVLGVKGKELVEEKYSYLAFRQTLNRIYDHVTNPRVHSNFLMHGGLT